MREGTLLTIFFSILAIFFVLMFIYGAKYPIDMSGSVRLMDERVLICRSVQRLNCGFDLLDCKEEYGHPEDVRSYLCVTGVELLPKDDGPAKKKLRPPVRIPARY